jgi:hypothetical protein
MRNALITVIDDILDFSKIEAASSISPATFRSRGSYGVAAIMCGRRQ